ncbi:MAG: PAS domain S-box protein [Anaerolineae bacterium]|nr:PAS domain S-box protein [Anaerolineae bacterium]
MITEPSSDQILLAPQTGTGRSHRASWPDILFEPSPEERRRARFLAVVTLAVLPIYLLLEFSRHIVPVDAAFILLVVCSLLTAYGLSRTRRAAVGSLLFIGTAMVVPLAILILHQTYSAEEIQQTLIWVVLTGLVASLMFDLRVTTVLIGTNIAGILVLAAALPEVGLADIAYPLLFVACGAGLVLIVAAGREQHLKQLELQTVTLRESEARFHDLFEGSFEGLIIHENGFILDGNPALERMTGYSLADLRDVPLWEFASPEGRQAVRDSVLGGSDQVIEISGPRKDGTPACFEMATRSHTYRGKPVRVSALRDITARKQVEQEREELIKDLDSFSHTVAHDLKNPVAMMIGVASLIEMDYQNMSEAEVRENLQMLTRQGYRIDRIIHEIMLLAGVRRNQPVKLVPMNMSVVVTEVVDRLSYMVDESGGELVLPRDWPRCVGYGAWVAEVWANYITNAIKYGGQPPLITLGWDEKAPDGMARFWVKDNGAGLTQEQQAEVFKPFTRLQQADTRGHGLGLPIVKRIMEKLNGEVGVESEPGQGSLFHFTLPLQP